MFPQVVQVPLLHAPAETAARRRRPIPARSRSHGHHADASTPRSAIGRDQTGSLAGRSLLDAMRRVGKPAAASYVLSASYGAVYAVVSRNGRRLYIADAIQERDYAYERDLGHGLPLVGGDRAVRRREPWDSSESGDTSTPSHTHLRSRPAVLSDGIAMNSNALAFLGLTAIVGALAGLLMFAMLRLFSAARQRQLRGAPGRATPRCCRRRSRRPSHASKRRSGRRPPGPRRPSA